MINALSSIQLGAKFVAPANTEKEIEADKWASGFQKLVYRKATSTNVQHVAVQANYFEVNFASSLDLRSYRTQLDQINSKDIVKRGLRRALIKALLEQHSPSGIWVPATGEPTFFTRTGFFTSMWPAVGRWRTKIPPNVDHDDLIDLRVTFNGVNPKIRVIRGVGARDAGLTTFMPTDAKGVSGMSTSVYNYMSNKYPILRFDPQSCCLNLGAVGDQSKFGFSVQHQFLEAIPRYLHQPTLAFKDADLNLSGQSKNKSSCMLKSKDRIFKFVITGTKISRLHIIRLDHNHNAPAEKVAKFARDLKSKIAGYGITFEKYATISDAVFSENRGQVSTHLTAALTNLIRRNDNKRPILLLIVCFGFFLFGFASLVSGSLPSFIVRIRMSGECCCCVVQEMSRGVDLLGSEFRFEPFLQIAVRLDGITVDS
ncbi:0beed004-6ed9-4dcd-acc1-621e9f5f14a1 [Sclerotinia trifoliorum]|uniref:0beed004-6ed9-4dcd-acc1-621e9f5f14a1 n=1 Tax=Sclerotinia trifoliorum TaxID=28548 RepID=A0A8H2VR00_9HELO|nr:0beed004-6ed9-4dcd-acc1-621e9f5f14a1 [Sclerotinia trifoliorum]